MLPGVQGMSCFPIWLRLMPKVVFEMIDRDGEFPHTFLSLCCLGGFAAQSVERTTPGEEVLSLIPAVAAPYWLGRCQYNVTG